MTSRPPTGSKYYIRAVPGGMTQWVESDTKERKKKTNGVCLTRSQALEPNRCVAMRHKPDFRDYRRTLVGAVAQFEYLGPKREPTVVIQAEKNVMNEVTLFAPHFAFQGRTLSFRRELKRRIATGYCMW